MTDNQLSSAELAILAHIGGDPISDGIAPSMAMARNSWRDLLLRLEDRKLIAFAQGYVLTDAGKAVLEGVSQ